MRIRTSPVKGAKATYEDVRGPTGARFVNWRWKLGERAKERFGLDVEGDPKACAEARRVMRNARKQERRAA